MTLRRPLFAVLTICLLTLVAAGTAAGIVLMPWKDGAAQARSSVAVPADPAVKAETSFIYTATLSRLIEKHCGKIETPSLDAASEAEQQADPDMAALAVAAAETRSGTMTAKSCKHVDDEIEAAERRAQGGRAEMAQPGH